MESIPKGAKREQLNPARFESVEPKERNEMRLEYERPIEKIADKTDTDSRESSSEMRLEPEPDEAAKIARIKERLQNVREQNPKTPDEWRRELTRIIDRGSTEPVREARIERVLTKNEEDFYKLNTRVKELETLTGLTETPEHVRELEIKRSMRDALTKEMQRQARAPKPYVPPARNYSSPIRKPTFFERVKGWFKNPFGI